MSKGKLEQLQRFTASTLPDLLGNLSKESQKHILSSFVSESNDISVNLSSYKRNLLEQGNELLLLMPEKEFMWLYCMGHDSYRDSFLDIPHKLVHSLFGLDYFDKDDFLYDLHHIFETGKFNWFSQSPRMEFVDSFLQNIDLSSYNSVCGKADIHRRMGVAKDICRSYRPDYPPDCNHVFCSGLYDIALGYSLSDSEQMLSQTALLSSVIPTK